MAKQAVPAADRAADLQLGDAAETAPTTPGRLVAIDGPHDGEVFEAATLLHEGVVERQLSAGISRWDASGLFTDIIAAPTSHRDVSPRTLLLLYAADLAFRLRWEIKPALEMGYVVVAAPYIDTAVAFGVAAGLSADWLQTLLRFAPVPERAVILRDRKRGRVWKRRPDRGFCEACTLLLEATPEGFARRKTRARTVEALDTAAAPYGGTVRHRDLGSLVAELVRPGGTTATRTVRALAAAFTPRGPLATAGPTRRRAR